MVGGRTVGAVYKAKFHLQKQDIEVITPVKWLSGRREQGDFIIIEAGRLLALQKKNGIEKSPKKACKETFHKCHLECQERHTIKRAVKNFQDNRWFSNWTEMAIKVK